MEIYSKSIRKWYIENPNVLKLIHRRNYTEILKNKILNDNRNLLGASKPELKRNIYCQVLILE